jgi:hypothetical protein
MIDPSILNPYIWYDIPRMGLTNGAAVASITDYGSANKPATQATGTKQGIIATNAQNGKSKLVMDAVDDNYVTATFTGITAATIFVVGYITGTLTRIFFSGQSQCIQLHNLVTVGYGVDVYNVTNSEVDTNTSCAGAPAKVLSALCNGASSAVALNNLTPVTGTLHAFNLTKITLNATSALSAFSGLNLFEMIVFNSALSGADIANVTEYLMNKYALADQSEFMIMF